MPCILNPTECRNDGECTDDNKGGYTCTCPNGYTGTNCDIGKRNERKRFLKHKKMSST